MRLNHRRQARDRRLRGCSASRSDFRTLTGALNLLNLAVCCLGTFWHRCDRIYPIAPFWRTFLCVFTVVFLCILQRVWRGRLPGVCESGALTILVIPSGIPSSSYYWFTAASINRSCYNYSHRNVDCRFLEDGWTDHDETLTYYGGWLPGEYRRCDDVIYHRYTPTFSLN